MNKKILSALIFTSLFVLSTIAVFAQPVAGASFKFGVPKEAKGMKLQSEVKVYDEDTWRDCIGADPDDRAAQATGNYREGYSSDGNVVGARSQSEINDWESDDWWFMGDTLLWTKLDESIRLNPEYDRTGDDVSDLIFYWDAIPFARKTILGFSANYLTGEVSSTDPDDGYNKPLIYVVWEIVRQYQGLLKNSSAYISTYINLTEGISGHGGSPFTGVGATGAGAYKSTYSVADVTALYGKKYDAVVVDRDVWYWEKTAEFESDPDEEGVETPFIVDPEDFYDAHGYFVAMTEALFDQVFAITGNLDNVFGLTNYSQNAPASTYGLATGKYQHDHRTTLGVTNSSWDFLNSSIYATVAHEAIVHLNPTYIQLLQAIQYKFGNDAFFAWYMILKDALEIKLVDFFRSKIPDRAEFLLLLLKSGIPAHQDVGNWLERLVDAFHIDKDQYWNIDEDPFTLDVSVDGLVVTAEIEWADGVLVDDSVPVEDQEERKDYDIVFTYGDTGGQSSIEYVKGDEVFFKTEGIAPTIPGFEISILLGAAAIATLGLIFVVMKKRRM